ncbi:hypothetical protein LshimejAT787_1701670 [Lyophyllum shimeji]|uniref:Uncharacterized protein n=1 Tax=Lyophyllum shimeji TaxID=47721 RepID=A0A9P3PYW1_LYOSH|nr:hypothetical protein LshimejAT787_1701670 [Lyophyllum shimeji]
MVRTEIMTEERFVFPEDNGLNLQELGQAQPRRLLNESYYHPQYQFPAKESDYTTSTHSRPRYKSGDSGIEMGAVKLQTKNGPSVEFRRERERALSNTSTETLIRRLIAKEYEAKEGRKLLRTAISQLEALQRRAATAEEARKNLESGQTIRGLKTAESLLDAQGEAARAKHELGLYRFQLEQAQREIRNKQHAVRAAESERDNAEKVAVEARELARQLNDERLVILAREEGRRLGYEEGMRQGRILALTGEEGTLRRKHIAELPHQTPLGSGAAFIEEYDGNTDAEEARTPYRTPDLSRGGNPGETRRHRRESRERGRSTRGSSTQTSQSQPGSAMPTRTSTPAGDAVRRELDATKERMEEMAQRETKLQETIRQWELREANRAREAELEKAKMKEAQLEREKREIQEKEEARRREMENILEREREKERELERERNEERRVREERERELEREREKVRELERERERERERESNSSMSQHNSVRSGRLPYLRMPQPPPIVEVEPPSEPAVETPPLRVPPPRMPPPPIKIPHQQVQPYPYPRGHRRQPSSPETTQSASSITTGTVSNLDIITFPTSTTRGGEGDWQRTNLSDIPEVPSIRSHSRSATASDAPSPAPTWLTNPPPDFTKITNRGGPDVDQWRRNTSNDPPDAGETSPNTPTARDRLSPSFQARGRTNERLPYGQQPRASSGSTIEIRVEPPSRPPSSAGVREEAAGFLSPNSAPLALVPEEPPAETGPVIPDMMDFDNDTDLRNFPPPGFVPFATPKHPSASEPGSSGSLREDQARGPGRSNRLGSSIYANFTPPVQPGGLPASHTSARQAPSAKPSIYANTPVAQGQYSTSPASRPQIYAPSSPSVSGSRPLQGDPSSLYGSRSEARSQIYAPPGTSSSGASQTPRQIYAPTPPSLAGTRPLQSDPSRIYASNSKRDIAAVPRQIYAHTSPAQSPMSLGAASRSRPVIPPPPSGVSQSQIYAPVIPPSSSTMSRIYAPASPSTVPAPLGPVRSGPVIPPPPGSMTPRGRNVHLNATPASFHPPPHGAGTGTATPRARFHGLDQDDGEDQDEETRWNTQANRVFGGSPNRLSHPPLPIPPPGMKR